MDTRQKRTLTPEELDEILDKHHKWRYRLPGGERAVLEGANLTGANLTGAYLAGANLTDANLAGANLKDANLEGANLEGANLTDANLAGANLEGANLTDANLTDAAYLPNGLTFKEFVEEVVPVLCTAGGKPLAQVANAKTWACHSWDNCPMAIAFGVHDIRSIPAMYRSHAALFVQLFDARLIPMPAA